MANELSSDGTSCWPELWNTVSELTEVTLVNDSFIEKAMNTDRAFDDKPTSPITKRFRNPMYTLGADQYP